MTNNLLSISFNQEGSCCSVGTESGFAIYNTEPFRETFRRDLGGGVGAAEMLFRCNILALVGGGASPKYPPTKVMVWDDHQGRCSGELVFRSEVCAVRLRRDCIAVVLEHKLYLYAFSDLRLLHAIETLSNPCGLAALSHAPGTAVLACPGLHRGALRLEWYEGSECAGGAPSHSARRTRFIAAHDGALAALALTADGSRVATASEKGTLVRVFATISGSALAELRRGSDRATIFSLALSHDGLWAAASSDKGTAHVWSVAAAAEEFFREEQRSSGGGDKGAAAATSAGSTLSFVRGFLPRALSATRSHAQLRLSGGAQPSFSSGGASAAVAPRSVCFFGTAPHTLHVAVGDGTFHTACFAAQPGECVPTACVRFAGGAASNVGPEAPISAGGATALLGASAARGNQQEKR